MSILQRNRINSFLRSGDSLPVPKPIRVTSTNCRPGVDLMCVRAAQRRTLQAIRASGAFDRDRYIPKKYESWEQKKARLQEEMSGLKHYTANDERRLLNKSKQRSTLNQHIEPIDESKHHFAILHVVLASEAIHFQNFPLFTLLPTLFGIFHLHYLHIYIPCVGTVLQEIEERIEWLNEMDKLGEGHKYKQMIQNEIAERMRLIKQLDAQEAGPMSRSF